MNDFINFYIQCMKVGEYSSIETFKGRQLLEFI